MPHAEVCNKHTRNQHRNLRASRARYCRALSQVAGGAVLGKQPLAGSIREEREEERRRKEEEREEKRRRKEEEREEKRRREEEEGKPVRLADQLAAVVEKRLTEQYDAGMQPAPIHPTAHVFAYGPCTHTARNLTAPGAVMRLDASASCDNSTLRAAAQRVADLATPMLHAVRDLRGIHQRHH